MVKILAICGFGVGTSLILRMNIEKVLKENNLEAEVEHIDVTTAAGAAAGFNQLYGGDDFSVFSGISSLISNLF